MFCWVPKRKSGDELRYGVPQLLAFEGDSEVEWFEGDYQDYDKDRKTGMGARRDQP